MSDSESDGDQAPNIEHVTGPIEDAWKMKIPGFTEDDNKHGKFDVNLMFFQSICIKYIFV